LIGNDAAPLSTSLSTFPMFRQRDFHLTPEDLQLRKRKRLRMLVVLTLLVVLGLGGFVAARPTRNAIKGWQARRHAQKAFAFIEQEKWKEAKDSAVAAYQLRPTEPEALRAVGRWLSRTRQPGALDFWKQLAERAPLTREDRRDEAAAALMVGEAERAGNAVKELLSEQQGGPAAADRLLAAQFALRTNAPADALQHLETVRDSPRSTERERLQAAVLFLSAAVSPNGEETTRRQAEAWAQIEALSQGTSETSLDALVLLAQRALSPSGEEASSPANSASEPPASDSATQGAGSALSGPQSRAGSGEPSGEGESIRNPKSAIPALITALNSHPLAKAPHKLIALDLEIHAQPDGKERCIDRATAHWKDADAQSLVALARWLNGKGAFQRHLDVIPVEKAVESRDLFLQHVDALGALGRWDEIKRLLMSERFPLDPVMQKMYLARCNAQLGETAAAENNWQRALEAAGGDVGKLMGLAEYAEKNGATAIAEAGYTASAAAAPKLRAAHQGRLRLAQERGNTKQMHAVLAEMLQLWPNDTAIRNDEAYTRLLLMPNDAPDREELIEIERLAEQLAEKDRTSLPHKTLLALSRLKQGRPTDALAVYQNLEISPKALSASALAVHAAVLHGNGQTAAAREQLNKVPLTALLPEEQSGTADLRN
jgi:hypothetical protein